MNKYTYVIGDPVNKTDRLGLYAEEDDFVPGFGDPFYGLGDSGFDFSSRTLACLSEACIYSDGSCNIAGVHFTPTSSQCAIFPPPPLPRPPGAPSAIFSCEQLLAFAIDYELARRHSPLRGLGPLFVGLGMTSGIDPAYILGILGAESTWGTAPQINGGKYNVYGASDHFNYDYQKRKNITPVNGFLVSYEAATIEVFARTSRYGLWTSASNYDLYEGEKKTQPKRFEESLGVINGTLRMLGGDPEDLHYRCGPSRKQFLLNYLKLFF